MQDHLEHRLDKLAKKAVKLSAIESPSLDFTTNVMEQIEATQTSHITVYKPLISKRAWFIIAVLAIGGFGYAIFGGDLQNTIWLEAIDFNILSDNKVTDMISGISFSKILSYAIGLGGLAWFVQISLTKNLIEKRLQF